MGQYHTVFNLDKKELISTHDLGVGAKLLEWGTGGAYTVALAVLLSNSNGRGGGDLYTDYQLPDRTKSYFKGKKYISGKLTDMGRAKQAAIDAISGRWAGDRIVVQGDYAEEGDKAFIASDEPGQPSRFTDISALCVLALSTNAYLREDLKNSYGVEAANLFDVEAYDAKGTSKAKRKVTRRSRKAKVTA